MPKFEIGTAKTGGRKAGTPNTVTGEVRAFTYRLLNSPKYRKAFKARLDAGHVAPALETMLWSYAYGKPPQDAPEPPGSVIPPDPMKALALKLLALPVKQFSDAVAVMIHQEQNHAPAPPQTTEGNST